MALQLPPLFMLLNTPHHCPDIERARRLRVYRQCSNIGIGQAAVDRTPIPAAVRAFEHAAGNCPRIERAGRRRVYRQGVNIGICGQAAVDGTPTRAAVRAFEHAATSVPA